MENLVKCEANYIPLTPITFLQRAALLCPDIPSIIYADDYENGDANFTWKHTYHRCIKLASSLSSLGLLYGDLVATLISNTQELYELHFGVPMAGGVLSPLNPSLDALTLSLILQQLDPKFVFLQHQYIDLTLQAFNLLLDKKLITKIPLLVLTPSSNRTEQNSISYHDENSKLGYESVHFDELLNSGQVDFEPLLPKDECDPILVAYTSGSTGNPKGVVYSHRATYLNTLGEIFRSNLGERLVFLWTSDMFRANGWGFTWAIPALGGTNVCLRNMNGKTILGAITIHGVNHFSGHPTILLTILEEILHNDDDHDMKLVTLPHKVYAHIAGILPSPTTMTKIEELGFQIVHRYGMTEVSGPPVKHLCTSTNTNTKPSSSSSSSSKSSMMDNIMEEFDVKDPNTMKSIPNDGKTIGEVMFRGNSIMSGYLKTPVKTKMVFEGGWFRTGDLAVRHPDGRLQLKDRVVDSIVNEGGSVSTLEIEDVLLSHPKVVQAAVVGVPVNGVSSDGEVPCAFLKLRNGLDASEEEIISFCSEKLPREMIPKLVIFGDLAISSTGKVQKFVMKDIAKVVKTQRSLSFHHP